MNIESEDIEAENLVKEWLWLEDEIGWKAHHLHAFKYIKTRDDWIEFADAMAEFAQHYLEEVSE